MNGLRNSKDMVHLQIKGKNQLYKEIEETQGMNLKIYDMGALHRNEKTGEIEGRLPSHPESLKIDKGSSLDVVQNPSSRARPPKQKTSEEQKVLFENQDPINEIFAEHYDHEELYC